jgi:predicted secreted Zn-dependent protease
MEGMTKMREQYTYVLLDSFDGKCLKLLTRVSSRSLARKHAQKFSRQTTDDFDLIECRNGGERLHIQHYVGKLNK